MANANVITAHFILPQIDASLRITGETNTRKRTFERSQHHTANLHCSLSLIATRVLTLFVILTFPTNGFNWSEIKSDSNVCRPCQQNFWRLSTNICFLVQQIFVAAYGAGTGYLLVSSPNLISPTGFIHKADKKASVFLKIISILLQNNIRNQQEFSW